MNASENPPETKPEGGGSAIIKKYANRRLYNTASSSYVTLDDLAVMVRGGVEFTVHDAKTGEDITRQVLTQIILEEENRGGRMLPVGFLRQLISLYGDSLQNVAPHYLEQSMQAFVKNQEQMRAYMNGALGGGAGPFGAFDEMAKRNMAVFENAMSMFSSFAGGGGGAGAGGGGAPEAPQTAEAPAPGTAPGAGADANGPGIDELRAQMAAMQAQLNRLSGGKS